MWISLYSTANKQTFCAAAVWLDGKVNTIAAASALIKQIPQ